VKSTTNIKVSGDDGTGSGVASCTNTIAGGSPGAYTLSLPTPDGSHDYSIVCTDHLGNASAAFAKTRNVDDTAPDNFAETLGAPNYDDGTNIWVKSTTNIKVSGDDGTGSAVASCTNTIDGGSPGAYTLGTNFSLPTPDGSHDYSIVCTDHLGNASAAFAKTRNG
jgi:hypothetical protein